MATNTPLYTGGLPHGELLGRYRSYDDAQKVVDHLAAAEDFNVKNLSIVGNDLRSVEHIRSRLSYPRVAGAGAAQGAMFGLFIGLLVMLFSGEAPLMNLVLAVILGMAIWMIIGVVSYAARRGKRDFASSSQLVATTFDIVCDFSVAGRARQLVQSAGVMGVNRWNDPTGSGPGGAGAAAPGPGAPVGGSAPAGPAGGSAPAGPAGEQPTSHPAGDGQPEQPAADRPSRPGHPAGASEATGGDGDEGHLPDGRPRYGARLSDYQASPEASAEPAQQGAQQPGEEASGEEPRVESGGETGQNDSPPAGQEYGQSDPPRSHAGQSPEGSEPKQPPPR